MRKKIISCQLFYPTRLSLKSPKLLVLLLGKYDRVCVYELQSKWITTRNGEKGNDLIMPKWWIINYTFFFTFLIYLVSWCLSLTIIHFNQENMIFFSQFGLNVLGFYLVLKQSFGLVIIGSICIIVNTLIIIPSIVFFIYNCGLFVRRIFQI